MHNRIIHPQQRISIILRPRRISPCRTGSIYDVHFHVFTTNLAYIECKKQVHHFNTGTRFSVSCEFLSAVLWPFTRSNFTDLILLDAISKLDRVNAFWIECLWLIACCTTGNVCQFHCLPIWYMCMQAKKDLNQRSPTKYFYKIWLSIKPRY